MNYDVVVIGGGSAGMSAGLECAKRRVKTLIIERNAFLGGILRQCIHNGFGLHYFGEEYTGPEYAQKFIDKVKKEKNIDVLTNTTVTKIEKKKIHIINNEGKRVITAKAIVLAMGCRERTAGNILLTGSRPAGIYTAGEAQRLVNIHGKMPGRKVVILGSGDIGLIMARRLTFEGAKVKAVLEINPTTSGLRRNVSQCLDDYNIPLMLKTTIFDVVGTDRVEGVYYGQVDEKYNRIEETRKFMRCDTIILSVGLVPETDLVSYLPQNRSTKSIFVNDYLESEQDGVFACGNVLHVHDLVDNVTKEGEIAGRNAALYVQKKLKKEKAFKVMAGESVSYVVPNTIYSGEGECELKFRLRTKVVKTNLVAKCGEEVLAKKFVLAGIPGEMQELKVPKDKVKGDVIVTVEAL